MQKYIKTKQFQQIIKKSKTNKQNTLHKENSYAFFPLFIYPISHSDCCYFTRPKCGLWNCFPGYITSLPSQPPSQHLATICVFWTASGAAGAHFRLSPKGRLLPSTESRWLQVPGTGRLACCGPILQQLFLSREEGR